MQKLYLLLLCAGTLFQLHAQQDTIFYQDTQDTDTLLFAGEVNGRNSFTEMTSGFDITVLWTGERWEIQCCQSEAGGPFLQFFSTVGTTPNPPDLTTGQWQTNLTNFELLRFEGPGTQAFAAMFSTPNSICFNAEALVDLPLGTPPGGIVEGPGITQTNETYTFNPAAPEVVIGDNIISYTIDGSTAVDTIRVLNIPTVDLQLPDTVLYDQVNLPDSIPGGGIPIGGVYSGVGIIDEGNGETFRFDPQLIEAGSFAVEYTFTDGNGCAASAADVLLVEIVVSTSERLAQQLRVYPNPVQGRLYVQGIMADQLRLYDALGKLVFQKDQPESSISVHHLPNGLYLLQVEVDGQRLNRRILKQ